MFKLKRFLYKRISEYKLRKGISEFRKGFIRATLSDTTDCKIDISELQNIIENYRKQMYIKL